MDWQKLQIPSVRHFVVNKWGKRHNFETPLTVTPCTHLNRFDSLQINSVFESPTRFAPDLLNSIRYGRNTVFEVGLGFIMLKAQLSSFEKYKILYTCLTCKSHLDCVKKYRARFSSTPAILQNCTIRLPSVALLSYSAISYTTCRHNSTQRAILPRRTNRASLGSTRTFQNLLLKALGSRLSLSAEHELGKAGLFKGWALSKVEFSGSITS